jgi:HEAT repeat protein
MLEDILKKLADPKQPLSHKLLRGLSGLDRAGLATVQQAWPGMATERRRQITHSLVEMSEDDIDMDFVDLFRAMLSDSDAEVRASACSGLWEASDERLVDPLIDLMQKDPAADVRAAAALTLGHFAMMAADGRLHGARPKRLLDALLATFDATKDRLNTVEVRRNALEAAAFFSDDKRVPVAIGEAYASDSLTLRAGAVSAMGYTVDMAWESIILTELRSPEPELRFEAARSAGDMMLKSALPMLLDMTADSDPEVRLMAIWALGEVGGSEAKSALVKLTKSAQESISEAAEEALETLRFNEDPLNSGEDMAPSPKKEKP